MELIKTNFPGLLVIKPKVYQDQRGWFVESFNEQNLLNLGIKLKFIQDNHSFSRLKGTLRGFHFQLEPYAQTKLVRCTKGSILDVVVDLRKGSPTYLMTYSIELSQENHFQLLIPKGFGHAFITLEDNCEVQYKVDNLYHKESDRSIRYDDKAINFKWPISNLTLSDKDLNGASLDLEATYFNYGE